MSLFPHPWKRPIEYQGFQRDLSVQLSSAVQSCPTLCNPMDCSTPGFPVHHQLPALAQTRDNRVGDAFQPPHPLLSPSPPVFNLSQHQGFFQRVSSSHQVAKQHPYFMEFNSLHKIISFDLENT